MAKTLVVDVFGKFACFTRANAKVERVTYDVPTPSACRGILEAIYCKPKEFHYQIKRIEVCNPIKYINIRRNEINQKIIKPEPIFIEKSRTQRNTIYLKNVYYRIYFQMIQEPGCEARVNEKSLVSQFEQRLKAGKCFHQPYLGLRECIAFFSEPNYQIKPLVDLNMDLGIMLYDNFDITNHTPLNTNTHEGKVYRTFYRPNMVHGRIDIPDFESMEVLKPDV